MYFSEILSNTICEIVGFFNAYSNTCLTIKDVYYVYHMPTWANTDLDQWIHGGDHLRYVGDGEKNLFPYPLRFCPWDLRIKLAKD